MHHSLKQSAVKGFASFESRLARSLFLLTLFYSIILGLILLISASITYSAFSSRLSTRFNRIPPSPTTIRIIQDIRRAEIQQIQITTTGTQTNPLQQPVWPTAEDVREDLIASLIFVNGFLLIIAIGGSYILARITLRPLKHAHEEQRRFIADASHELRTPLAVMKIELENELASIEDNISSKTTGVLKDAETIKSQLEEVDRMSKIVQNLLILSKLDGVEVTSPQMKISEVDLVKSVSDATTRLQALAKKHNVQLTFTEPTLGPNLKSIYIKGNEQVPHILTNIIQNAIIYNKQNGTVDISITIDKNSKSFATVTIVDSGVGISKEDLAHIFDRFYRVDKSRSRATGGSGLGLSIVERGIKSIGGNIQVESELNKGTTIKLFFKKI